MCRSFMGIPVSRAMIMRWCRRGCQHIRALRVCALIPRRPAVKRGSGETPGPDPHQEEMSMRRLLATVALSLIAAACPAFAQDLASTVDQRVRSLEAKVIGWRRH